jgi:hypothetical protein
MQYWAIYLVLVVPMGGSSVTHWQVKQSCSTVEECQIAKRDYLQDTSAPDGIFICTLRNKGGRCTTEAN